MKKLTSFTRRSIASFLKFISDYKKSPIFYLILIVTLVILVGGGIFGVKQLAFKSQSSDIVTHTIFYSDQGFTPSMLVINLGETVTFTSSAQTQFWPASDPHPTHEYLNGFDAELAISAGQSWSHTFTKAGSWQYHDHLQPTLRGQIIVLDSSGNLDTSYCQNEEEKQSGECFDHLIKKIVNEQGIEAAYAVFEKSFAEGKLPRGCHWTAHQIGEAAYKLFKQNKSFELSEATTYCGYGFYHGFLESLLRENRDIEYALSFCDQVAKQLGRQGLDNCYHGIGHGFTEDPPDPKVVGNFDAMVKPGIEICEYLFGSSFVNLNLCLTGVFTVPAEFAEKHEYGLELNTKQPFELCRNQPYRYQKACVGEFTPKLDAASKTGWNFSQTPQLLDPIKDKKTVQLITWVLPAVMVSRDIMADNFDKYVLGCKQTFEGSLEKICLGGTIQGIFTHGQPSQQHQAGLLLCQSQNLTSSEKEFCFKELGHRIRRVYTESQVKTTCQSFPSQFQQLCFEDKDYTSTYDDPIFDQPEIITSWRAIQ